MSKAEYKDRKYEIGPYDPMWPDQFQKIASIVKKIFGGDAVAIEHIGSTSVPEMIGKPTIDILVLVDDLSAVHKHSAEMEEAGYEYLSDYVLPGTVLFRQIENNALLANIHIFQKNHPHVHEMLSLRDYLRSHPEEVKAYSDLKKVLFKKYSSDYGTYRKFKDAYMEDLKKRALQKSEEDRSVARPQNTF